MRELDVNEIKQAVKEGFIHIAYNINDDVLKKLSQAEMDETEPLSKTLLEDLVLNSEMALKNTVPLCQDTGMAIVNLDIGQDVHFVGGDLNQAINDAVSEAYTDSYLRKSIVADPLNRKNTGDNTPALVHFNIVPGENVKISIMAKGFGSENMSQIKMLTPSAGLQGVKDFIIQCVKDGGSNPCPPIVVGVGIGGSMEKAAFLSKESLFRPLDSSNPDPFYADLEKELLEEINKIGIGPMGFGGKTTALGLMIETAPTHIAGLPVAVNICCHSLRRKIIVL